jgi:hypothetical protein
MSLKKFFRVNLIFITERDPKTAMPEDLLERVKREEAIMFRETEEFYLNSEEEE